MSHGVGKSVGTSAAAARRGRRTAALHADARAPKAAASVVFLVKYFLVNTGRQKQGKGVRRVCAN